MGLEAGLTLPSFSLHPLPLLLSLLSGALGQFVDKARDALNTALGGYLFGTYDVAANGARAPFTVSPGLASINHLLALAAGSLLVAIFIYSSLRTVVEAGGDYRHQLQVVVPRGLVAVALAAFSLPLIQQLVNLNNALCQVVVGGAAVSLGNLPWSSPLSGSAVSSASNNIFLLLFAAALVLGVVILALAYVVRYTLLMVLCACAPLAATAWILPETRGFARQWGRLLVVCLFMQFVQLLVLRVAVTLAFAKGHGVIGMLYSFACLYLMLRVPGALNVATHFESSAEATGRRWGRAVRRVAATEV